MCFSRKFKAFSTREKQDWSEEIIFSQREMMCDEAGTELAQTSHDCNWISRNMKA